MRLSSLTSLMNEPFSFGGGSQCALAPVLSRASHVLNYFLLLPALSVARAAALWRVDCLSEQKLPVVALES